MIIGKYKVTETHTLILPRGEKAIIDIASPVGMKLVVLSTKRDEPSSTQIKWYWKSDIKPQELTIEFVNLNAPMGGALKEIGVLGQINEKNLAFLATFQTYTDLDSFGIQIMIEE